MVTIREMDELIAKVKHEASQADEAGRQRLLNELRDLSLSIEHPSDTSARVISEVSNLFEAAFPKLIVPTAPQNCHDSLRHRSQSLQHPFGKLRPYDRRRAD